MSQPSQMPQLQRRLILLIVVIILALATLACSLLNRVISSDERPPVSESTLQAERGEEASSSSSSDSDPMSTDIPVPTPVTIDIPNTADWSFTGVQALFDPTTGGLQVYGDMTNNTSTTQQLLNITGTAFDAQDQAITAEGSVFGYSPFFIIPSEGRVPFALTVPGIQSAASINLNIEAELNETIVPQEFDVSVLDEQENEDGYCLKGTLQNPGETLQNQDEILLSSVQLVAVLYNAQGNVINFLDSFFSPDDSTNGQSLEFEICVDPLNQEVAGYELRVWGQ